MISNIMIDAESRFKSLIQPIRDLSLNWDIDIADELNDYLDELENLEINFSIESGKNNLNFAEAALLIQGSAAVYSKKVEYLHQLVLHALELITTQKNSKANAQNPMIKGVKVSSSSASFLDDDRIVFGTDPDLLLLDDVLDEGSATTLLTYQVKNIKDRRSSRYSLAGDLSKSSMILMHSVLHEDHGSTSLRLSSCRMDHNGALLIGGEVMPAINDISIIAGNNSMFLTHSDHKNHVNNIESEGGFNDDIHVYNDDFADGENYTAYTGYTGNAVSSSGDEVDQHHRTHHSTRDSRDTADRDHHMVNNEVNKREVYRKVPHFPLLDPHEVTTGSRPMKKGSTHRIPISRSTAAASAAASVLKSSYNMERKLKQNDAFVNSILSGGTISAAGASCFAGAGLMNTEFEYIAREAKRKVRTERVKQRIATVRNEEQYLYSDPFDAYAGPHTVEAYGQPVFSSGSGSGPTAASAVATAAAVNQEIENFWSEEDEEEIDDDMNYDGGPAPDMGMDDSDANLFTDAETQNAINKITDQISGAGSSGGNEYFGGSKKPLSHLNPFASMFEEEEELARRVEDALNDSLNHLSGTYENLCKRHIQQFMKGAELYARETQLSKRVGEWTRKLEPVLRQQEESSAFDIHAYADNLLLQFSKNNHLSVRSRPQSLGLDGVQAKTLATGKKSDMNSRQELQDHDHDPSKMCDIEDVAHGMSAAEVSRMFLACLQLANSGNIEIMTRNQKGSTIVANRVTDELDLLSIHLLKDQRECGVTVSNIFDEDKKDGVYSTSATSSSSSTTTTAAVTVNSVDSGTTLALNSVEIPIINIASTSRKQERLKFSNKNNAEKKSKIVTTHAVATTTATTMMEE